MEAEKNAIEEIAKANEKKAHVLESGVGIGGEEGAKASEESKKKDGDKPKVKAHDK